ncbi:MAG: L-threonylcarbamoyladenylate synthase [Acetanaerobacterium sp.]
MVTKEVEMQTNLIEIDAQSPDKEMVAQAGKLLAQGGLVAIPTETVYGLAANALDGQAVRAIFAAKGRPQDNPLIVHIADPEGLTPLVRELPQTALALAKAFWPGPLTMILGRSPLVPAIVSAGLDTVAVRMPSHPVARAIIRAAGVPLAAPSANRSGSPSPTTAAHVMDDLGGRIPLVVDGGACGVGVESTVVSLISDIPVILRPGAVTREQLERVVGKVRVDDGVLHQVSDSVKASSPGMKYRHYSPRARVIMVEADSDRYCDYVNNLDGAFALCFEEDIPKLHVNYVNYGAQGDASEQARLLFFSLRELDRLGAKTVYARAPIKRGLGLAVYNRLLRAAGFEVVVPT